MQDDNAPVPTWPITEPEVNSHVIISRTSGTRCDGSFSAIIYDVVESNEIHISIDRELSRRNVLNLLIMKIQDDGGLLYWLLKNVNISGGNYGQQVNNCKTSFSLHAVARPRRRLGGWTPTVLWGHLRDLRRTDEKILGYPPPLVMSYLWIRLS